MKHSTLGIVLVIASTFALSGCGGYMKQVCAKAMTVTTQLQGKLADAQRARADLDKKGVRELLPPAMRDRYDKAVAMADEGYALAVEVLANVDDVCNPPDIHKGLDLIIKAWDILVPLLGNVGGQGTPNVDPPMVWKGARDVAQ
jgi:hypothetical protein